MRRLILASGSPRRKELLERAGFDFDVCAASIEERQLDDERPVDMVVRLSFEKAANTVTRFGSSDEVHLAADTIVIANGRVYGKPKDFDDSVRILSELLGRNHEVLTGWTALPSSGVELAISGVSRSIVRMREAGRDEIEAYVRSGEPLDKAGGYAAQGLGRRFIAALDGPLDNVIGLPVSPVRFALAKLGILPQPESAS